MKRLILLGSITAVVLLGLFSNPVFCQDQKAVEVLEGMQERYEESIEDIYDYVIEKENHIIFYKKFHKENGRPYFETKSKGKSWKYAGSNSINEAQKEMAKKMMGDKIEKYRKMIENNRYEKVSKVKEIKVNTGMEDF